ncbi:uncharacterized protein LAESUDRAFT_462814 [Laetiporus sulphureus 93-53]|uniref:Uncharacterized protein n=1 Tax=Laetiporus sulphureus 93-53 TaxID=1314785 RepID=A0A165G5P1_9APHY|nr:uncharacterized protein LAESUDRAFT_462814 [Laetiporus sulphureus 93-53]KZT09861.1 hypothetical protein LAESUDRAFT_462814 [Laetiporus sulphureus 93-53]
MFCLQASGLYLCMDCSVMLNIVTLLTLHSCVLCDLLHVNMTHGTRALMQMFVLTSRFRRMTPCLDRNELSCQLFLQRETIRTRHDSSIVVHTLYKWRIDVLRHFLS